MAAREMRRHQTFISIYMGVLEFSTRRVQNDRRYTGLFHYRANRNARVTAPDVSSPWPLAPGSARAGKQTALRKPPGANAAGWGDR